MFSKTALFAATIALASPAMAGPVSDAPQVTVGIGDLDLTSDSGIASLNHRIRAAAIAVCPEDPGLANLSGHGIHERCVTDAAQRAQSRVDKLAAAARAAHAAQLVAR